MALLTLLKKFHEHHIIKMPNYSNFIKGVWNFSNNSKKQNCEFVAVVIAVSVKKIKTNKKSILLNLNSSKRKVGNSNIAQNHSESWKKKNL